MEGLSRPLPAPDVLTQPFWDAARQGKLAIQRCQTCHTYYHPPVRECLRCVASGSPCELAFEPVSGRGRIYSHTLVHDTRLKGFEAVLPYRLIQVELAEQVGLLLFANMPDSPGEAIRIGAAVEVVFIEIGDGFVLPEFRLASR